MNLKEFVNPPKRYRPCPVWSWNAVMEPSEIENRVREMKRKGFGGFVIQARSGLKTVYLGDDWMRAVRRAVETARETELECWFHDDDRSPSGSACGAVSESNSANIAMALIWIENAAEYKERDGDIVIAYARRNADGGYEQFSETPESLDGTGCFIARRAETGEQRYHGAAYTDLLNPDTVRAFLDSTHEKYSKLFRYDFGEFLPGIFTSGPTIERSGAMFGGIADSSVLCAWTPGLPDFFEGYNGFRAEEKLHLLITASDEGSEFKKQLQHTIDELFIKTFTIAVSEWCSEREFKLAGYVAGSDIGKMAHYDYISVPSVAEGPHETGAVTAVKTAGSVAGQLGKDRVICRILGGAGNAASYLDMKRSADLALVSGATVLSPAFVQYSMLGDRKRDIPPTLSYHQYHWEHIRTLNDYFGRCSWAVSNGRPAVKVLVMAADNGDTSALTAIIDELSAEHIACDIGSERILKRHGSVGDGILKIGGMDYSLIVLPKASGWRLSTLGMLEKFSGPVLVVDNATAGDGVSRLEHDSANRTDVPLSKLAASIAEHLGKSLSISNQDGSAARDVRANHRSEAGAHLLYLVNTDAGSSKEIVIDIAAIGGVVELDALSGRAFRYASETKDGRTVIRTELQASGSKIFLIDQTQTSSSLVPVSSEEEPLSIEGPYSFQRNHENALAIDRCRLDIDGKTLLEDTPLTEVRQAIWQKTGIDEFIECQPWYIEQRNVRTRTNRTVLTFKFNVRQATNDISLAMESADRFTVKINGTKVETTPGKWYLDKRLPVIDLEGHVIEGVNTITAETDYLWDTEVENIYLIGDFAVGSEGDGFPVITEEETLSTGSWTEQGYPFYPGSMTYSMEFGLEFAENEFFELDLSGVQACNTFVTINGSDIGSIPFPPYRADITGALKQGSNTIEIEVFGTLGNLLGETKPGAELKSDGKPFTEYGLIEAPKLIKIIE